MSSTVFKQTPSGSLFGSLIDCFSTSRLCTTESDSSEAPVVPEWLTHGKELGEDDETLALDDPTSYTDYDKLEKLVRLFCHSWSIVF